MFHVFLGSMIFHAVYCYLAGCIFHGVIPVRDADHPVDPGSHPARRH